VVQKSSNQPKTDTSKSLYVGVLRYDASEASVSSFTLPGVDSGKITYTSKTGTTEETLVPYIRAKPNLTSVSIPNSLEVNQLQSDTLITNDINVGSKLQDLESRLNAVENRFGI